MRWRRHQMRRRYTQPNTLKWAEVNGAKGFASLYQIFSRLPPDYLWSVRYDLFCFDSGLGFSILSGALTLSILILPVIIRTTEEALMSVPQTYREGSYGLGASGNLLHHLAFDLTKRNARYLHFGHL
ncbi:ABC transporter permease subunit [Vibrio lentus]|nr:ABC transporter permease subunit [Vibrio lentus]